MKNIIDEIFTFKYVSPKTVIYEIFEKPYLVIVPLLKVGLHFTKGSMSSSGVQSGHSQ